MSLEVRAQALTYILQGWRVFPLHGIFNGACTCGDPTCDDQGKHPYTWAEDKWHGHLDATLDPADIERMFPDGITRNIGIATGDGLAVIDIDPRHGGDDSWDEFCEVFDIDLDNAYRVQSGGNGVHFYFSTDRPTKTVPNLLMGVDLKADGGYVVAPPSMHISGGTYTTTRDVPLTPLPEPVLEAIDSGIRPRLPSGRGGDAIVVGLTDARQREIFANPALLGPGERDTFFTFAARDLIRAGKSVQETVLTLAKVYEGMANPLDDYMPPETLIEKVQRAAENVDVESAARVREIGSSLTISQPTPTPTPDTQTVHPVSSTYELPGEIFDKWHGEEPPGWAANDDGVAALVELQWGHRLRFDLDAEEWLVYDLDQGLWVENSTHVATEMVKDSIRSIQYHLAAHASDSDYAETLVKFAIGRLNAAPVSNALKSLSTRKHIAIRHHELNNAGNRFPVRNGVVEAVFDFEETDPDYAEIPFTEHTPNDLFTHHANLNYDPHVMAPFWFHSLKRWFPDPEVRDYMARLIGYAVFGGGGRKIFVVALGKHDSGKSAFFNGIQRLLGDFATTVNATVFMQQQYKDEKHADLAKIDGKRLIVSSEPPASAKWDSELMKTLVSGGSDALQVRYLYKNFNEVRNRALICILANDLPTNEGLDDALTSRMVVVPFEGSFPRDDPDTIDDDEFMRRLDAEVDGILQWIVTGYSNYLVYGLTPPGAVKKELEKVEAEQDWRSAYASERLEFDAQATTVYSTMYTDYLSWCDVTGDVPVSKPMFGRVLTGKLGLTKKRASGGVWTVYGARLRPVPLPPAHPPVDLSAPLNLLL